MAIYAVQNPLITCQVEGNEREKARQRGRIELRVNVQDIGSGRHDALIPFFLLEKGGFYVHQLGFKNGFYLAFCLVQIRLAVAVDSKVQA